MILRSPIQSFVPGIVCIFLFCLSFFQKASVICIILLAAAWLLNGDFKKSVWNVFQNKILLLLVAYYFYHLISVLYSSNLNYAFFDLQVKLSFLLFPFIISGFTFNEKDVKRFKLFFIAGALFASVFCFINAFISYQRGHDSMVFFYEQYSYFMHPSYFSLYLNLAVLFLIENIFNDTKDERYSWMKTILAIFLFANISMLSSRTALMTSGITVMVYFTILFFQKKIVQRKRFIVTTILISSILIQLLVVNIFNRFTQVTEAINSSINKVPEKTGTSEGSVHKENSTTAHFLLWKNAFELIKRHPFFGVGIGDIKDELVKIYEKNNFQYGVDYHFNPHNQYLHTGVSLGLVGILLLLIMLAIPFAYSIGEQEWIYAIFILIIFLNGITESILERQAGILFFAFLNSLFAVRLFSKDNQSEI